MHSKIRAAILESSKKFDIQIIYALQVSILAGDMVQETMINSFETKENKHSIVTEADLKSERRIIGALREANPRACFLSEESAVEIQNLITADNLNLLKSKRVFVIDPLDGTAEKANGSFLWSISIGILHKGKLLGGAIYAPDVLGGFAVWGQQEKEVMTFWPQEGISIVSDIPKELPLKEAMVVIGQDIFFVDYFKRFKNFLEILGPQVRMINTASSCALSLAQVITGQKSVYLQTPNGPWDWAAGIPLLKTVGGKVNFFRLQDGKLNFLTGDPEISDYNPDKKTLGFIGGIPSVVDEITAQIMKHTE